MNSIIDKESNENKGEHVEKKENAEYYKTGGNGWDSEENMWENGFNQMMKIIRELPSFDNEKENRLYSLRKSL